MNKLLLFLLLLLPCWGQSLSNDHFSKALPLTGDLPIELSGKLRDGVSGVSATRQEGEPKHAGRKGFGSVWYSWTAEESLRVTVSVSSQKTGLILAAYRGEAVDQLALVQRYDDFALPGFSRMRSEPLTKDAQLDFNAKSGERYYFAIDTEIRHSASFKIVVEKSRNPLKPELEVLKAGSKWEALMARTTDGMAFDPEVLDKDFDQTWCDPSKYDGPPFESASPAPLGYGEINGAKLKSVIGRGGKGFVPQNGRRFTCYFRTTFTPEIDVKALGFEALIDDGAIIYINGKEVVRINVAPDADADEWETLAHHGWVFEKNEAEDTIQYGVARGLDLPAGKPVSVAVSLHNVKGSSSDIGMDMRIYAVTP